MEIFTMQDWKSSFNSDIAPFVAEDIAEIEEDIFYNFLESVPPIYSNGYFLNSEPYSHNKQGKPLYNAFASRNGHYYFLGLKTH